jgi:hypothetical protein
LKPGPPEYAAVALTTEPRRSVSQKGLPVRPVLPLSTIGSVPMAYEGIKGRKNTNKEIKNKKM